MSIIQIENRNFKKILSKRFVTLLTGVIPFMSTVSAHAQVAGTQGSGGGGAWYCMTVDQAGKQHRKTELLDLWEGYALPIKGPKLTIPKTNEPIQVQFDRAVAKLAAFDPALPAEIKKIAGELFGPKLNRFSSSEEKVEIAPPSDALNAYKKVGCWMAGMMYYNGETGKLDVDSDFFDLLESNTDIAASIFHEAWYYLVRKQRSIFRDPIASSVGTRKLTGCLFSISDSCLKTVVQRGTHPVIDVKKNKAIACKGSQFEGEIQWEQTKKFGEGFGWDYINKHVVWVMKKYYGQSVVPFNVFPASVGQKSGFYGETSSISPLMFYDLHQYLKFPVMVIPDYPGGPSAVKEVILMRSDLNQSGQEIIYKDSDVLERLVCEAPKDL